MFGLEPNEVLYTQFSKPLCSTMSSEIKTMLTYTNKMHTFQINVLIELLVINGLIQFLVSTTFQTSCVHQEDHLYMQFFMVLFNAFDVISPAGGRMWLYSMSVHFVGLGYVTVSQGMVQKNME
jgi:hypothetical protein